MKVGEAIELAAGLKAEAILFSAEDGVMELIGNVPRGICSDQGLEYGSDDVLGRVDREVELGKNAEVAVKKLQEVVKPR